MMSGSGESPPQGRGSPRVQSGAPRDHEVVPSQHGGRLRQDDDTWQRCRGTQQEDAEVGQRDDAPPGTAAIVEPEPPAAREVFGSRIAEARKYAELLAGAGTERGLIGPRESGRLWTRHILNCAGLAEVFDSSPLGPDFRIVDIGSGAGLPGIPLALASPELRVDLVEPLLRRSTFLDEVVDELALADRVRVVRGRAEEVIGVVGGADAVTSRAVAPLAKLAVWSAPLLRSGGMFVALKGRTAADEIERDRGAAARAGIINLSVLLVGEGVLDEPTTLIVGERADSVKLGSSKPRSMNAGSAATRRRATHGGAEDNSAHARRGGHGGGGHRVGGHPGVGPGGIGPTSDGRGRNSGGRGHGG